MSVAITGPKGYEYRYKVTVLISLLKLDLNNQLFVEMKGGEDASLKFNVEPNNQTIELQMKSESSTLDLSKLINWLCHFEERDWDNNLLSKLENEDNTIALFITQARCSDEVVRFKVPFKELNPHSSLVIDKSWKDKFQENIRTNVSTGYKEKRAKFCQQQALRFKDRKVIKSLGRNILIWEEITEEKIDATIKYLLNNDHQIPDSNLVKVYLQCEKIVTKGRNGGYDIIPDLYNLIKENKKGRPQYAKKFITRDEIPALLTKIEQDHILLLTGISLCGKSQIAKKIAAHFFDIGYNYRIVKKADEARQFLNSNQLDKKIVIIDDPLGHGELADDHHEIFSELASLFENLSGDNKIIVTSRAEILQQHFETDNLKRCKIARHSWTDLTLEDNTTVLKCYQELPKRNITSDGVVQKITNLINKAKPNEILQIGELEHLLNADENLNQKSAKELEHLARFHVKELSDKIKKRADKTADLLAVLAMCGDNITPIDLEALVFIFSKDKKEYSTMDKSMSSISFSGEDKKKFPKYENDFHLPKRVKKAINYLDERNFIDVSDTTITFTHPNYYEVGRYLFFYNGSENQGKVIEILKKSVTCLSSENCLHAIQQLPLFYQKNKLRNSMINIALNGLNSIFPSVEDFCLGFLIDKIQDLEEEILRDVIYTISGGSTEESDIYWHNQRIPFISNDRMSFQDLFFMVSDDLKPDMPKYEKQLVEGEMIESFAAWNFIKYQQEIGQIERGAANNLTSQKAKVGTFKPAVLKTLLQYREVFIRKELVPSALAYRKDFDLDIINTLFDDKHPDVVYRTVKFAFTFWIDYPKNIQNILFGKIEDALRKTSVAIRAFTFITNFGKDYISESIDGWEEMTEDTKRELWRLWSIFFPSVIKIAKMRIQLSEARFGVTMTEALDYLSKEDYMRVADAWFEMIDDTIKTENHVSDWILGLMDNVMIASKKDAEIRKHLFTKILDYPHTGLLLVSLKAILFNWGSLSPDEKTAVLNLLGSDRIDKRWIKVLFLTRDKPPKEIVEKITGHHDLFDLQIEEILKILPSQLLEDCLRAYVQFSGSHDHYSLGWKNRTFWKRIIDYIFTNDYPVGFDVCLWNFLFYGLNGLGVATYYSNMWAVICQNHSNKSKLTKELIYHTGSCTFCKPHGNFFWTILVESYKNDNEEEELLKIITKNIELLQQKGDANDLLIIFDAEMISKIYEQFSVEKGMDAQIYQIFQMIEDNQFADQSLIDLYIEVLEALQNRGIPVRCLLTYKKTKRVTSKFNLTNEQSAIIEQIRIRIEEVGSKQLDEIREEKFAKLEDWIYTAS